MGYNTNFDGILKFKHEPTGKELAKLKTILGQDCRNHKEWETDCTDSIDLMLTDDFSGVTWDESEKTYNLDKSINILTTQMRKKYSNFCLQGTLTAVNDYGEHFKIILDENGFAECFVSPVLGDDIECPCCKEKFILKGVKRK